MIRFGFAPQGRPGQLALFSSLHAAVAAAFDHLLTTDEPATVLRVEGPADDLTFTPLCTVVPPITPPSTSPGGFA